MTTTYWAAEPVSSKVVEGFSERRKRYFAAMATSGRAQRMRSAWTQYYGWGGDGQRDASQLTPTGGQSELVDFATNDFAGLLQQAVTLLTANPPAWKSVAENTDFRARATTALADALCSSYERHSALSEREQDAAVGSLMLSEMASVVGWDYGLGADVRPDESGGVVKAGDVCFYALPPWDFVFDPDCQDVESLPWIGFRIRRSRWELAARVEPRDPALAEKIRKCNPEPLDVGVDFTGFGGDLRRMRRTSFSNDSDFLDVWELRHPPSAALPNGRLLRFCDSQTVVFDSVQASTAQDEAALYPARPSMPAADGAAQPESTVADFGYPYGDEMHVHLLAPERAAGGLQGHTSFFDLLTAAANIDTAATAMASAANAGGLSNWFLQSTPDGGAPFGREELAGGMNILRGPVEPKVIQGIQVDPQAVAFAGWCLEYMRRRIGLNAAALGETQKGMPAQLAALLQTQAIQFYARFQRGLYRMQAGIRSSAIDLLQRFARAPRTALVAGPGGSWMVRQFEAKDLEGVERVTFEPLAPQMRTPAGRQAIAESLLDRNLINKQQFLDVLTTGRLESAWQRDETNQARIQREKELLQKGIGLPPVMMQTGPDGRPVLGPDGRPLPAVDAQGNPLFAPPKEGEEFIRPLITDTNWLDVPADLDVIAAPEARSNPAVLKAVLDVVTLRLKLLRSADPLLIALQGGPVELIQSLQAQALAPMPGAMPPGQAVKPEALPGGPEVRPVQLPKPPPDPATGKRPPAPEMDTAA